MPNPLNPQDFNRFSYVRNNPIKYIDPTGHMADHGGGWSGGGGCMNCNPPTCTTCDGGGSGGGAGGGTGGGSDDPLESFTTELFYYNPFWGGSKSGCNIYILHNADGSWCHHTTYTPRPICLSIFHCSTRDQMNYALRFQYPGQMPWMPVTHNANRYVMFGDIIPNQKLRDLGAVWVEFHGQTMTNFTYETHIFYEGRINRTVSDNRVTTEGYGTNANGWTAAANQYVGPVAFEFVDDAMLIFSTADQLSHGALAELMDAIP